MRHELIGMELSLDIEKRYTYADYLTWFDDVRRELIDGLVKLLPAPKDIHAKVSKNISVRIGSFILAKEDCRCDIRYAPFDVRLPKNGETKDNCIYTVVQPDICVICDLSKLDDRGCIGAPDLIIEIVSKSSEKRDAVEKRILYEKHGVREYWVVYPKDEIIQVFLLDEDGKYPDFMVYASDEKIPVHVLTGYEIDVNDIFK